MGFICLYVLIQKSGQKTAKSHLCALCCFLRSCLSEGLKSWWGHFYSCQFSCEIYLTKVGGGTVPPKCLFDPAALNEGGCSTLTTK